MSIKRHDAATGLADELIVFVKEFVNNLIGNSGKDPAAPNSYFSAKGKYPCPVSFGDGPQNFEGCFVHSKHAGFMYGAWIFVDTLFSL